MYKYINIFLNTQLFILKYYMSLYYKLIDFRDGKIDSTDLRRSDDSGVLRVGSVTNNRSRSLITLNFDNLDYFKIIFPNDDNNNSYIINFLFSYYGGGGSLFLDDYYFNDEEWDEGYIYDYFSEENKKLFKDILLKISPKNAMLLSDSENRREPFIFIKNNFERYVDDIVSEYAHYYDECLQEGAKKYILNKSCNVLTNFGIFTKSCASKYFTTVGNLIKLWDNSSVNKDIDSFIDFLGEFVEENNLHIDEDLWEDYYSYYDSINFDSEGFNSRVTRYLEQISDKVDEDLDSEVFQKNIELSELMSKLDYKFGAWYNFPKSKNFGEKYDYIFRIDVIDNGKIECVFKRRGDTYESIERFKMTKEEFTNFLNHPELFS